MKKQQKHVKHLAKSELAEAYGWFGSTLILVAYGLQGLGIVSGNSPFYHLMFMVGSSGLAVITYRHRAFQSFTVNVLFTFFAFIALIRLFYFA